MNNIQSISSGYFKAAATVVACIVTIPIAILIIKKLASYWNRGRIPPDTTVCNSLFFECHKPQIVALMEDSIPALPKALAELITSYVVGNENPFGAEQWNRYFGAHVSDLAFDAKEFYRFWFSRDPVNPSQFVFETHYPPVFRPQHVIVGAIGSPQEPYSLNMLGRLIQKPKEGARLSRYATRDEFFEYSSDSDADTLCWRYGKLVANKPCWLVLRKREEVIGRNKNFAQRVQFIQDLNKRTHVGYEKEPFAIDVATVVCVTDATQKGKGGDYDYMSCEDRHPRDSLDGRVSRISIIGGPTLFYRTIDAVTYIDHGIAALKIFKPVIYSDS